MKKKPNIQAIVVLGLLVATLLLNYLLFGPFAVAFSASIGFLTSIVSIVLTPFPFIVLIKSKINLRLHD